MQLVHRNALEGMSRPWWAWTCWFRFTYQLDVVSCDGHLSLDPDSGSLSSPPDASEKPGGEGHRVGQRCPAGASEHQHPGLGPEHPLLIRSQDQCLASGHEVRLGGDMPFTIEEEHPQQLAGGAQQVNGNHADRALALDRAVALVSGAERASHGRDGERPHRCGPVKPAPRKGRGTQWSDSRQPLRGARAGAGRVA